MDSYMLLAERLRDEDEKALVQSILEKHICVKIDARICIQRILQDGRRLLSYLCHLKLWGYSVKLYGLKS